MIRMGKRRGYSKRTATVGLALAAAVVAQTLAPSVAYGSTDSAEAREARDRLAQEFRSVLSLRQAPESMCLAVNLDDQPIVEAPWGDGLVPASLMKVVTGAAALEVMSPDETFSTPVYASTDSWNSVSDGVLQGDLYLVGRGDPVLSTPRYMRRYQEEVAHTDISGLADQVFHALQAQGITRIEGRLVGDESWYPDRQRDYTGERPIADADPVWKASFVHSNNAGPLSALSLNQGYSSYSLERTSAGRRRATRAANPAQHAASVFDDFLEARGMIITQRAVAGSAPPADHRTLLGNIESPPLSEILARMLTYSDNTIAEMVLKEVGRRTDGSSRIAATAAAGAIIRHQLGPLADGLVIADGSGLSSHNRFTCAGIVALLQAAGPGSPLVEGLSVAGRTGTLQNCHPVRSPANDQVLNPVNAKTGTLNDVTALAGSAVAANGQTITFSMIANRQGLILLGGCNRLRRTSLNAAANYSYGPAPADPSSTEPDRQALVALYDHLGGEGWFNTWGWRTELPLDQWHGIATDSQGRVTGIDLSGPFGNGLTGTLPREVGLLSRLVRLDLSGNDLIGPLPPQLSELTQLTDLRLDRTGLCPSRRSSEPQIPFSDLPFGSAAACSPFRDAANHPHAPGLTALANQGILTGTECGVDLICPDDEITRWETAVWLGRAVADIHPTSVAAVRFTDVDPRNWWGFHVERFAEQGVTLGCDTNPLRYCPTATVTRGQMAAFLVRAWNLPNAASAGFADTADHYFEEHINALAAAGVTVGCATNPLRYCPDQPVSKAQMATFISRALGLAD